MTDTRSIVEQYFAAFGAGDTEAALACVHPDAIWHVDGDPIVGTVGIIRGRDAVRAWQTRFPFSFRSLDFSVERLIAGAHAAGSVARRASINGTNGTIPEKARQCCSFMACFSIGPSGRIRSPRLMRIGAAWRSICRDMGRAVGDQAQS